MYNFRPYYKGDIMAKTNSSNSLSQPGARIRFPNFHHDPRRMLRITLAVGMSIAIIAFSSGLSLLASVAIVAASMLIPITVDALLGFFSRNPSRRNPPAQTSGTMPLSQDAQTAILLQPSSTPAPTPSVDASARTTAVPTTSATILQTSSSTSLQETSARSITTLIPETLIPSKIASSTATIMTALNPNETFITPIAQPNILSSASIAAVDTLSVPRALDQNSRLTPITTSALNPKKLDPKKVSTDNPFQNFNRHTSDNPLTNISSQSTGQTRRR